MEDHPNSILLEFWPFSYHSYFLRRLYTEGWTGTYGDKTGLIPSNYVKEVDPAELRKSEDGKQEKEVNPLGDLTKSSVPAFGLKVEIAASLGDQRLVFKIVTPGGKALEVAPEDGEMREIREWQKAVEDANKMGKDKAQNVLKQEKKMRIAIALSDMIFYCTAVKWKDWQDSASNGYQLMSSFGENTAEKMIKKPEHQPNWVEYNMRQFSRVYPKGTRVKSDNYDPQQMWNFGMQLVALNYQTPDRPMWLNTGKFAANGRTGYISKPAIMLDEELAFDPTSSKTWNKHVVKATVKLKILSARHLIKPGKGVASPFVKVDVSGVDCDQDDTRTKVVQDNGFKPRWNQSFGLEISMPELACINITVFDEDMFGDSSAIGQAVLPVGTQDQPLLNNGYRSVMLQNTSCCEQELSALLVHVEVWMPPPFSLLLYPWQPALRAKALSVVGTWRGADALLLPYIPGLLLFFPLFLSFCEPTVLQSHLNLHSTLPLIALQCPNHCTALPRPCTTGFVRRN
jgi:phosphatidylinositol phospholipase C gamma-1